MAYTTAQLLGALLMVDGRAVEGGAVELPPNARLLLDVIVEGSEPGALLDDIAAAVVAAQAARDAAVDISGISTSDGVVEALVKNTAGAGPLTSAALSATIGAQVDAEVPPLVTAALAADATPAAAAAAAVTNEIATRDLIEGTDQRVTHARDDINGWRIVGRDSAGNARTALGVDSATGDTTVGDERLRDYGTGSDTAFRVRDRDGRVAFSVDKFGNLRGIPESRTMIVDYHGGALAKQGPVLTKAASGFDAGLVEGPCFYIDHTDGKEKCLYVGYTNPVDSTAVASVGRVSVNADGTLDASTRQQFFTASGVPGSADEKGVTGPVILTEWDPATGNLREHLFYIGLTTIGYEGGDKKLCHASRNVGDTTWTRHGVTLAPTGVGLAAVAVWHPNFVKHLGRWYCFVNCSGYPTGKERVVVALGGPTLDDAFEFSDIAPFAPLTEPDYTNYTIHQGDPFVWRWNGMWRMDFFVAGTPGTFNKYAITSDKAFPYGWRVMGATVTAGPDSYDAVYAHKPSITLRAGKIRHYYTAVGSLGRCIALAIGD